MRIVSIQAEQGHIVPSHVLEARGPFGRYEPKMAVDEYVPEFPPGATAQNGMREVLLYECRNCGAVVREDAMDRHECEE